MTLTISNYPAAYGAASACFGMLARRVLRDPRASEPTKDAAFFLWCSLASEEYALLGPGHGAMVPFHQHQPAPAR